MRALPGNSCHAAGLDFLGPRKIAACDDGFAIQSSQWNASHGLVPAGFLIFRGALQQDLTSGSYADNEVSYNLLTSPPTRKQRSADKSWTENQICVME